VTTPAELARTADEVVGRNRQLDDRLRELVAQAPTDRLHDEVGGGEWPLASNLGHIAEFPRFFGRELALVLDQPGIAVMVGRTHEHPERNAAVAGAAAKGHEELAREVDAALDDLGGVLDRLTDGDLQRIVTNRKYGPESLATYLQRYVLSHKAAHVDQLGRTLAALC
jgi:uncharacterized damage-inducible protein DinB